MGFNSAFKGLMPYVKHHGHSKTSRMQLIVAMGTAVVWNVATDVGFLCNKIAMLGEKIGKGSSVYRHIHILVIDP
jgi:hypothetical protein